MIVPSDIFISPFTATRFLASCAYTHAKVGHRPTLHNSSPTWNFKVASAQIIGWIIIISLMDSRTKTNFKFSPSREEALSGVGRCPTIAAKGLNTSPRNFNAGTASRVKIGARGRWLKLMFKSLLLLKFIDMPWFSHQCLKCSISSFITDTFWFWCLRTGMISHQHT